MTYCQIFHQLQALQSPICRDVHGLFIELQFVATILHAVSWVREWSPVEVFLCVLPISCAYFGNCIACRGLHSLNPMRQRQSLLGRNPLNLKGRLISFVTDLFLTKRYVNPFFKPKKVGSPQEIFWSFDVTFEKCPGTALKQPDIRHLPYENQSEIGTEGIWHGSSDILPGSGRKQYTIFCLSDWQTGKNKNVHTVLISSTQKIMGPKV